MAGVTHVTVEIEEAKQELALLLTRLDERSVLEKGSAKEIALVKQELAELKSRYDFQAKAYDEVQDRLWFLKLPDSDCDRFYESASFKGDVTFVVHASIPRLIRAHRFVLAGRSAVFHRMFEASMLEKRTVKIHIKDASYGTMWAVVNFCYTADISYDDSVLPEEVLKVAHKYDIYVLRTICDEQLCKEVDPKYLPKMLRLSRTYDVPKLQIEAMKYFKTNFDVVQESVLENLFPRDPPT